ncbi:TPA: hypothetical protein ACH3X3_003877 [Trebouxia sp. C0006]
MLSLARCALSPLVMLRLLRKNPSQQFEYGKLDLLFAGHSSTTPNRVGTGVDTPYTSGTGIPLKKAAAGEMLRRQSSSCL